MAEAADTHPLLEELKGLISRLKQSAQPIQDGHIHLVPFCETLELIFRNGLKQPYFFNSFFNKQDYWCWIQPLQDYYFNEKQNPLFSKLAKEISSSSRIRSLKACGRCFIRAALTNKLISVPVEHLLKNAKLTQYWYSSNSIIGNSKLQAVFMELLFQATEVDFNLDYQKSGFLDETWVIPVYVTYRVPPVKVLDITIRNVDKRELIINIEEGCLAQQAGVEVWDVIEEICGRPIEDITGRVQKYLAENSKDYSEITVVKKYLSDGSPFAPILRRQLLHTHNTRTPTYITWVPEFLNDKSSSIIRTTGNCTEYSIVFLGNYLTTSTEIKQDLIDNAVSNVLNKSRKPEEVMLSVGSELVHIHSTVSREKHMLECSYSMIGTCRQSSKHQSCIALVIIEGVIPSNNKYNSKQLSCYICETPTFELAQCICMHIGMCFDKQIIFTESTGQGIKES